jgi:hypothetical protein
MVAFLGKQTEKSVRSGVSAVACQKITLAMRDDLVMGIVHKMGRLRFLAI